MLEVFTANVLTKLLTTIVENSPLGDEALGGGYTPPLIDEIYNDAVDTLTDACRVDTTRLGDTKAGAGYEAPLIVEMPTIVEKGNTILPAESPEIGVTVDPEPPPLT